MSGGEANARNVATGALVGVLDTSFVYPLAVLATRRENGMSLRASVQAGRLYAGALTAATLVTILTPFQPLFQPNFTPFQPLFQPIPLQSQLQSCLTPVVCACVSLLSRSYLTALVWKAFRTI
jgi:hypothetical protein